MDHSFGVITCPLIIAIAMNDTQIVRLLLEFGADPDGPSDELASTTPLYAATFETGLRRGNPTGWRDFDFDIVRLLLEGGADINKPIGGTMLLVSGESTADPVFLMTRRDGVYLNVDGMFSKGATPLHMAAGRGAFITELFLKYGADVKAVDFHGRTALHYAVVLGRRRPVIEMLIEHNVDVDAKDNISGKTALMIAARGGEVETVTLLLELGADRTVTDDNGSSALDYAILGGSEDVAELLRSSAWVGGESGRITKRG
jgi:ankyrin repeat protein